MCLRDYDYDPMRNSKTASPMDMGIFIATENRFFGLVAMRLITDLLLDLSY